METMIPPQLGMTLRTKNKRKIKRKKGKKRKKKKRKKTREEKKKKEKMREKREGIVLLPPFPHLCIKVAPCSSYRESHVLSHPYASGNFSL